VAPRWPEALAVVEEYLARRGIAAGGPEGGALHIVLADQNVERAHVEWCRDQAREKEDEETVRVAEMLLEMSQTQRLKVATLCGG
jgi:hypothetical protein